MSDKQVKFDPSDIIYVEDVIELFGGKITKGIIYNWIREKKLPAIKVGTRYIFSRQRVEAFLTKKLGIAS